MSMRESVLEGRLPRPPTHDRLSPHSTDRAPIAARQSSTQLGGIRRIGVLYFARENVTTVLRASMRASRTLPTSFAFSVFKVSPSEATASFRRGATRIDLRSPSAGHDLVETGTRVTTSHECMPCTASAKVHGAWHGAWCLVGVDSRLVFLRVRAVRPRNRAGAAPPMCGEHSPQRPIVEGRRRNPNGIMLE